MSSRGPPVRMQVVIDLTSDDNDIPASKTIDLTSVDEPEIPNHDLIEPKVKVEDQSPSLAISSSAESGESSPKVPRDYETSLTESNHNDAGELSPRNPGHGNNSSSEDNLPLSAILARNRKRSHVSDDVGLSQSKPTNASVPITREALASLVSSQSLKPGSDDFWSVHKPLVNEPSPIRTQKNNNTRVQQQESQAAGNSNPYILNIDREEVFGNEEEEKKKKKQRRDSRSSEKGSANRQVQLDRQILSGPNPSGGGFETPRNKFRTSGTSIPSQPLDDTEIQRPRKRLKLNRRETIGETSSIAVGPNTFRSKVAVADRRQGDRPKTKGIERSSSVVNKATGIGRSSATYRPGGLQRNRWEMAAVHEKSHKKQTSRPLKKLQDVDHGRSSRQQGGKKHPMTAQSEQRERGGLRPAGIASQHRFESNSSRRPPPRLNQGLHEARRGFDGLGPSATAYRLPLEGDFGHIAPVEQDEGIQESQELPDVYPEEPQQVYDSVGQQQSRSIQPKLNTTQLASRVKQLQPTRSSNTQTKDLEEARAFFQDRYSQSAQKRKTILVDSVPANLGKPNYTARRQMIQTNAGRGSGPKRRKGIKDNDGKRALYRQRAIESKRQVLQSQVDDEFPYESKEDRERRVEAGLAELRRKFERNDQKREAQKPQGLLTVDFLEDVEDTDPIDRLPATAVKGKQRGIPVSEALEPGATILLYAVYTSDPVEKGVSFDDSNMKRLADQFLKKEDANKHAEEVLRNHRLHDSKLVSIQFRVGPEDGLFFGIKELADGKTVMCMVQGERQICGDLNLRDIFVEKGLKEIYSPRFDVFYITVTPKVFLEKKKARADGDQEKKSKAKPPSPVAVEETQSEPVEKENVDEDSRSLFSATPTPEPEAAKDDGDKDEEEDEDSDADSVNTDITISPPEPGGNLGSLSWKDVEYSHEHVDGFTTLELANKEALKVARELWRPKGSRMDPWLYYNYSIEPSLREMKTKELDLQTATLEFEVPEFEGHVDDRPWPFIYSRVFVEETRLEGPRDIGNYIVMDNGEESDRHDSQDGAEDGAEDGADT